MRAFDLLINILFYCFVFCFMRSYFWLIEPKPSKKAKDKKSVTNILSRFLGLYYLDIYKYKKSFIVMYCFFLILFVFSFILSICECFIHSDLISKISKISGKILWYYFCIVGFVYWFVRIRNEKKSSHQ